MKLMCNCIDILDYDSSLERFVSDTIIEHICTYCDFCIGQIFVWRMEE
jgi:hypothetical protein